MTRYRVRFEGELMIEDAPTAGDALARAWGHLAPLGDSLTHVTARPADQINGREGFMGSIVLPDWARRAARTFVQAWIGSFLLLTAGAGILPGEVPSLAFLQRVALAALWAAVIATLTGTQNALEDHGAIPAFGKSPASAGANPVPDSARHLEPH